MLEKPTLPIKPVPVRQRVERKEERVIMHALRPEYERPVEIGGVEQANRVGVQQGTRRLEWSANPPRAMDRETTVLRVPATDIETASCGAAFCKTVDPGDAIGPVSALLAHAEEIGEVLQRKGLAVNQRRADADELKLDPKDHASQSEAANRPGEQFAVFCPRQCHYLASGTGEAER